MIVEKDLLLQRSDHPNEGTRQECRNAGSMNCNFFGSFIKSVNQSSIKPWQVNNPLPQFVLFLSHAAL